MVGVPDGIVGSSEARDMQDPQEGFARVEIALYQTAGDNSGGEFRGW